MNIIGTINHCGPPTEEEWPNPEVGDVIVVDCDKPTDLPDPDSDGAEDACADCDGDAWSWVRTNKWISIGNLKGKQGDKGDPGESATVSVKSTTTGAAGTDALVTNSGSTQNAELNFTIPRGDQGIQGPPGPGGGIGPEGPRGPKGDKGDKGDDGDTPTISLTDAVDVKKDDTVVNNKGTFTLQNTDPLNPQYTLSLELIPDSGEDIDLKMCQITDVSCPEFPPVNGEVLVQNTTGDGLVWEPKAIGYANSVVHLLVDGLMARLVTPLRTLSVVVSYLYPVLTTKSRCRMTKPVRFR